jgi:shikimate dehydrogenase
MQTYGLLGRNISYSLSPAMHNAAFKALKLDARYEAFDTPAEELDDFFSRLRKGEISGCNVTIPYKERALGLVDNCTSAVNTIGALNTIVREDSALKGHNTDYNGFLKALIGHEKSDLGFNPEGRTVFVFGAGGAARAVVYVLSKVLGAKKIIIADIDAEKAETLAGNISEREKGKVTIAVANDREQYNDFISHSDLLINTTPCGMKESDPELFDYKYIDKTLSIFDLVYTKETPLIKEARSKGATAINGVNMLLYQAARSFELWTGEAAPLDAMRKALSEL